ncbi:hypothetical protein KQI65_18010 [bacterium]|nr:hypothetical protein [bacterium]
MKLYSLLTVLIAFTLLTACSDDDPSLRVRNDLDVKVNVQLKPDAGNTINMNDIAGGSESGFMTVQDGWWTATASVQSSNAEPEARFEVKNNMNYTVVIVNTDPPEMQILSEEQ